MGNGPFIDSAEFASFPLSSTGKREGGEKMQPLHHFSSYLLNHFIASHLLNHFIAAGPFDEFTILFGQHPQVGCEKARH